MVSPSVSEGITAQQKSYVTYTAPSQALNAPQIILLEARSLLGSSGTTGLRTWEAALHLGTYLFSSESEGLVAGKNIIELGAGTGFLSILCAKHLGAKHVLATDGDGGVVDDLTRNIYLNGLDRSGLINTALLRWGHVLVDEDFETREGALECDLVLGADVVRRVFHRNRIFDPLVTFTLCIPILFLASTFLCSVQGCKLLAVWLHTLHWVVADFYLRRMISPLFQP